MRVDCGSSEVKTVLFAPPEMEQASLGSGGLLLPRLAGVRAPLVPCPHQQRGPVWASGRPHVRSLLFPINGIRCFSRTPSCQICLTESFLCCSQSLNSHPRYYSLSLPLPTQCAVSWGPRGVAVLTLPGMLTPRTHLPDRPLLKARPEEVVLTPSRECKPYPSLVFSRL